MINRAELKKYGIHFRVDAQLIEDFYLLKEAWGTKSLHLDCIQAQALSDIHALERCGWITWADMEFFENYFIYSDEGFHKTED